MREYAKSFIIASFGAVIGMGFAAVVMSTSEPVIVEKEVIVEVPAETKKISATDMEILLDSVRPMLPDMQKNFCRGDYESNKPGTLGHHMCESVIKSNAANFAALGVLDKLTENDLVDFSDAEGGE